MITKLESSIARINAIRSCAATTSAKSNNAGGLEPVIFMAKGSRVMLTSNLWQQVGLCNDNSLRGLREDLLYTHGHKPPDLPIAILVNFPDYSGPPFIQSKPKCIPVPPIVFEWHNGLKTLSQQQIPLRLSYAMTIHKSHNDKSSNRHWKQRNGSWMYPCSIVST